MAASMRATPGIVARPATRPVRKPIRLLAPVAWNSAPPRRPARNTAVASTGSAGVGVRQYWTATVRPETTPASNG
jgi:hypothetical protein